MDRIELLTFWERVCYSLTYPRSEQSTSACAVRHPFSAETSTCAAVHFIVHSRCVRLTSTWDGQFVDATRKNIWDEHFHGYEYCNWELEGGHLRIVASEDMSWGHSFRAARFVKFDNFVV